MKSKPGLTRYLEKIEALGGMIKALERGYVQQEIQNAAYEYQQQVDREEAVVVGVNRFAVEEEKPIPIQRIDEALERKQVERLRALRARARARPGGQLSSKSKPPPAPEKILCREFWPRSKPTPRSAKSPTRCEKSLENTTRPWLSGSPVILSESDCFASRSSR